MDAVAAMSAVPTSGSGTRRRLESVGMAITVALLLQVVVGIANTLWLDIPDAGNAWLVSSPMMLLTVHLMLALAVTVLSIWLLVDALLARSRAWIMAGVIGLLGVLGANAGGFVSMSMNGSDGPSFVMATGCVVSIGAYAIALAKGRNAPKVSDSALVGSDPE